MARIFPGGVATDLVVFNNYAAIQSLTTMTLAAWIWQRGQGGNNGGRVMDKGGFNWICEGASTIRFSAPRWATLGGAWTWGRTLNVWRRELITYDYGSDANDPAVYVDGVSIGAPTETSIPSGTLNTDTTTLRIGNRTAVDRAWDGALAEVTIWNRILSSTEITQDYTDGPSDITSGRVFYAPLTGFTSPETNQDDAGTGTVTGTEWGPHPPYLKRLLTLRRL
jgi:hypothetical protein